DAVQWLRGMGGAPVPVSAAGGPAAVLAAAILAALRPGPISKPFVLNVVARPVALAVRPLLGGLARLLVGDLLRHGVAPDHVVEKPQGDDAGDGQGDPEEEAAADQDQEEQKAAGQQARQH